MKKALQFSKYLNNKTFNNIGNQHHEKSTILQ